MTGLRWTAALSALLVTLALLATRVIPARLEQSMNTVRAHATYEIGGTARALHQTLVVGDLHTDSTLWDRDLLERADYGHVDLPRLREGNVAIQLFTAPTKSPRGQNYERNSSAAGDNLTLLAMIQAWPPATWISLTARAEYQAQRLHKASHSAPDQLQVVTNSVQLGHILTAQAAGAAPVAALLGTEGSHALDGSLANLEVLHAVGYRVMGLHHFFDNRLGGSLHGESGAGLTDFGREAVVAMIERGVIIDLAHSSEQVVRDALALNPNPMIVSHTGFKGHCDTPRNISDALMQRIAAEGGLIGVGFWDAAVCDPTPEGVVSALRYGIELLGADHIALGSDYDGSIDAPFDISELAVLTDRMLTAGFTEGEIRKVMGGNMARFFLDNLP